MNNFKNWISNSRNKVIVMAGVIVVILIAIFAKVGPQYIEMYKNVQSAQISLLNDDLEGALVGYEKAYEATSQDSVKKNIEEVQSLIASKSNYLKGEQANENMNYDSAYYYYQNVIPADEKRYEDAQEKLKVVSKNLVESIYEEVNDLYDKHLYLMIIGKLELALSYGVNVEKTQEKIEYYQEVLFDYYVERAEKEALTYFNHELFYSLFLNSLEEASKYAITDEQVEELQIFKQDLIANTLTDYCELAKESARNSEFEEVEKYYDMINTIDENSEESAIVKELLQ